MCTCQIWLARYWCYPKQHEHERKRKNTTTNVCYAQKIAHNRYLPKFSLSIVSASFTIIIFCYRLFILERLLPKGICTYRTGLNRNRLRRTINSNILVLIALSFLV